MMTYTWPIETKESDSLDRPVSHQILVNRFCLLWMMFQFLVSKTLSPQGLELEQVNVSQENRPWFLFFSYGRLLLLGKAFT
jgi:hypothetical protein